MCDPQEAALGYRRHRQATERQWQIPGPFAPEWPSADPRPSRSPRSVVVEIVGLLAAYGQFLLAADTRGVMGVEEVADAGFAYEGV